MGEGGGRSRLYSVSQKARRTQRWCLIEGARRIHLGDAAKFYLGTVSEFRNVPGSSYGRAVWSY